MTNYELPENAFAKHLQAVKELRDFGKKLIACRDSRSSRQDDFVRLFVARATTALQAVECLFRAQLVADAFSPVRTICELLIDLAYILHDEDAVDARIDLFVDYRHVVAWREAEFIMKLHGMSEDDPSLCQLRGEYEKVKKKFERGDRWCELSIRKRAEHAEILNIYDGIYRESSAFLHSGPITLSDVCTQEGDGAIRITTGARPAESARVLVLAGFCYVAILQLAAEQLSLKEYVEETHRDWLPRLRGLANTEDGRGG